MEDYSLYKGLNRTDKKVEDYGVYAKIYIRADNKKIEIKRRYQDLMEYYADSSSLLLSIFWILGKIFAYYDRIKANHSISKKLFYFEGIKENKFYELKKIKNILEQKFQPPIREDIKLHPNDSEKHGQNSKNKLNGENTNSSINDEDKRNQNNNQFIDFSSYNILEMLLSFNFCICKTKKLKAKIDLIKQARKAINDKLDIVLYIRNMFIFELINNIKPEKKEIYDFLSRPIIYLNQNKPEEKSKIDLDSVITNDSNTLKGSSIKEEENYNKIELKKLNYLKDEIYKTAYKLNTNDLTNSINILKQKKNQTESNKNLYNYLNNRLKGV